MNTLRLVMVRAALSLFLISFFTPIYTAQAKGAAVSTKASNSTSSAAKSKAHSSGKSALNNGSVLQTDLSDSTSDLGPSDTPTEAPTPSVVCTTEETALEDANATLAETQADLAAAESQAQYYGSMIHLYDTTERSTIELLIASYQVQLEEAIEECISETTDIINGVCSVLPDFPGCSDVTGWVNNECHNEDPSVVSIQNDITALENYLAAIDDQIIPYFQELYDNTWLSCGDLSLQIRYDEDAIADAQSALGECQAG